MIFRKTKYQKEEVSRESVFSKIAKAKQNGQASVHIDAILSMELENELIVMGYRPCTQPGFSSTNIYWKNSNLS